VPNYVCVAAHVSIDELEKRYRKATDPVDKLRGCRGQRARSEKFFLRMYGKLFVLTACVAQNVPSKTGRCCIPHAHSWHVHTRNKVAWCSRLIHRR
jgi:hypothetical protein